MNVPQAMLMTLVALLLAACESAEHDMYAQPEYKPQAPSPLFADGSSARTPPAGTVVATSGATAGASSGRNGRDAQAVQDREESVSGGGIEPPVTLPLLQRGRDRFDIFCAPCHGRVGDGNGMVVQRGFPAPASFQTDALRAVPDVHLYDVISRGSGVMYPFADRLSPPDRWAIVAYIRALQLSQHASSSQLDVQDLRSLDAPRASRSP